MSTTFRSIYHILFYQHTRTDRHTHACKHAHTITCIMCHSHHITKQAPSSFDGRQAHALGNTRIFHIIRYCHFFYSTSDKFCYQKLKDGLKKLKITSSRSSGLRHKQMGSLIQPNISCRGVWRGQGKMAYQHHRLDSGRSWTRND